MPCISACPACRQCVFSSCAVSLALSQVEDCRLGCLLQVFSIREAATANLQRLAREFGPDWAKEHLVPQVRVPCVKPCAASRH